MITFRRKILKVLAISTSVLILTVIAAFGFIYFEAQSYLNRNLSEFVLKKSKGKYELSFENLQINFSDWGFEISQISFHPTDSILKTLPQLNPNKQFYSFSSPNIRFEGISLVSLLLRRNLEIGQILISQPELKIHGQQAEVDNKEYNLSSLLQELKPLVTKTFHSIRIDKIELANASFDFYSLLGETRKLANGENITIGILNFYTDSLILPNPNRIFNARDIYLQMHNYQNRLADSIHTLHAEFVTYSLKSAQIEAKNLDLEPNDNLSAKDRFQILVPELRITSKDINDLFQNKSIPIDSMIFKNAKIKYWTGLKNLNSIQKSKEEFNLYDLIKSEFSSVQIQNFKLENAQLMQFKARSDLNCLQDLKNININLENFILDSVSNKDTSRIFYSKNIDFSASGYELTLGDNIHRMSTGPINLSTQAKSVLVKNIQLYPIQSDQNKHIRRNTIEANCDSVRLDLFNFKKAFHQKRFVLQQINLFNPKVKLTQNEISEEKTRAKNPSFIYSLISNYVKGVYSNQVIVQKGKLQLVNKTGTLQTGNIESNLKLQLSGFALDEISSSQTDRLFFANQIELNFSNYQMQLVDQLHKLTIEDFSLSTRRKLATLTNLHLFPVSKENMEELLQKYNRSQLYEFTIPELSLKNADFHQAFFNKKFAVDTFSIKTPQIYYENFGLLRQDKPKADFEDLFELLSSYLDDIRITKVDIPDGTIRLINHSKKGKTISLDNQFSLSLENLLINKDQFGKKKLLYSEFVDFTVRDHIIRLSDNVHVLKAEKVGFSSRNKEVFVINARLYPETNSKNSSTINWNIQLSVPEIRIKGINIERLYFDHQIDADQILINVPQIKLYQKHKNAGSSELKEMNIPLPKEIESIAIRDFKLNDGSLKVFSEFGIQPYLFIQSDLNVAAKNIFIKNNLNNGIPEFDQGEFTFQMVQFKFMPKDKNQQFSIDELTFSTADKQIQAKQLTVKPKIKDSSKDQFELSIPNLEMNGLNLDQVYRKNQYYFESISVEKPSFQYYNNAKDSTKFNPFKANLYRHFESFADVFASESINVIDADITAFKNGQKKLHENVTFHLSKVRIDDQPNNRFMHSNEFSFRIPNLKRQDKLYQYGISEIGYSSEKNRVVVKAIRIIPNFSKEDHQKQVGFQSDYLKGKIDSVCIEQPNINRWFDKEELAGKFVSVNGLNMDFYRDKRLSFDEKRKPPMFQDLIKSLKYSFIFDSLKLQNSSVTYTEQPITGEADGKIGFSNIQARLMPFTNMKTSSGKIPDIKFDGNAIILDSCQLQTNMNFRMDRPDNLFTVNGSLSPFKMRILNPILEPLAKVSIRSGKVEQFQFSFSADSSKATGNLILGYNDLKISVLELKNGNTKEAKFLSFLANSLMLRSKNPKGKVLLPEEIIYPRDHRRSVINYCWKSIFSGIRGVLGIKDSKQEKLEKQE